MSKIFLVRHGRTEHDGCFVGTTESVLAQSGVNDITALKRVLCRIDFTHVYCSPRKRCLQTAELLGYNDIVRIDDGLKEIDFGRWEGLSFKEAGNQYPDIFRQLVKSPLKCTFPGGQSMEAFFGLIEKTVERICASCCCDENILIISHGGVLRVMLSCLLQVAPERLNAFSPAPGRYSVIDYAAGAGVLEGFNLLTDNV